MNGEARKRQKSPRDEKKGIELSPPTREKKGHKEDKRTMSELLSVGSAKSVSFCFGR